MEARHHTGESPEPARGERMRHRPYRALVLMAAVSLAAMYGLMYAMVDTIANVYPNFNQFYMAGLMAAAMVIIEIGLMGVMYHDRTLNAVIVAASLAAMIAFWVLIRQQAGITDRQFLRSMIPHHASALLMCEKAPIDDPEVKALCGEILSSQQAQIDQMKAKLDELEN